MEENLKNCETKEGKVLPQYGKKGHKPRKNYSRGKINIDEISANDIKYWNQTSGYENVTKFAWNNIIGMTYPYANFIDGATQFAAYSAPAIMSIEFAYGPGYADSVSNGVNRSLARIMASIRASLSTSNIGFETADLGIFLSATSSIAIMLGHAKRVLESRTVWKDKNYVYPRGLVQAMGFKWKDIANHYNDYAARLNSLIDMYNGMKLLDIFMIYDRQYSLAHSIFADEDSELGQLYIFKPAGYYTYDDTATPSKATWHKIPAFKDFNALLDTIQTMIDSWYGSSDLYTINGVLHRAFKDAPLQNMPYYTNEIINPVVERTFLMQIMNMTICSEPINMDITQEPTTQNYVIWKPSILYGPTSLPEVANDPSYKTLIASHHLLRLFENDVTADDNMELTRLMAFGTRDSDSTSVKINLNSCGSEFVTHVFAYKYDAASDSVIEIKLNGNIINLTTDTTIPHNRFSDRVQMLEALSAFRYIPTVFITSGPDPLSIANFYGVYGDTYNWMQYSKR